MRDAPSHQQHDRREQAKGDFDVEGRPQPVQAQRMLGDHDDRQALEGVL